LKSQPNIPKPSIFRYCNNWRLKPGFKEIASSSWQSPSHNNDALGTLVAKLKNIRRKAKGSKKTLNPDRANLSNAKQALDLMDWIEKRRPLTHLENTFKRILKNKIDYFVHITAITARQIGKVTWCVMRDEDMRFYHARASARLRYL
jgi:hypothetical protein